VPARIQLPSPPAAAPQRQDSAGLRRTRATVALTALFKDHPELVLTQAEVESSLHACGVDVNRVTVYRLLDRFVRSGLLQRQVGPDRITRFSAVDMASGPWAPRFECEECHRQFRLQDGSAQVQAAARKVLQALQTLGHEGHDVEVSVRGRCAGCAHPAPARRRRR
jgi:Fur family transcriptional regulator, ferric uptake regulator